MKDTATVGVIATAGGSRTMQLAFPAGVAEFERAIELDPSLESAYRSLAEIYSRAGNADGVRKTFERYLKFMPNSMTARKALLGSTSR
jgi:tetratricopeptide (TPR) repeat protein